MYFMVCACVCVCVCGVCVCSVGRKSGVLSAMKPCPQPDFNFSKCDSGPTSDAPAPTTNTGSLSESK